MKKNPMQKSYLSYLYRVLEVNAKQIKISKKIIYLNTKWIDINSLVHYILCMLRGQFLLRDHFLFGGCLLGLL